jgi:hypothetical protein
VGISENVVVRVHSHEGHLEEMTAHLESLGGHLQLEMEELAREMEHLEVELGEEFSQEVQARVEAEMKAVQIKLQKLEEGGIR